jgi:hypothetical protein
MSLMTEIKASNEDNKALNPFLNSLGMPITI